MHRVKASFLPFSKKGDTNEASNYRGVTLINTLSKVYSQLLLIPVGAKSTKRYHKINLDSKRESLL